MVPETRPLTARIVLLAAFLLTGFRSVDPARSPRMQSESTSTAVSTLTPTESATPGPTATVETPDPTSTPEPTATSDTPTPINPTYTASPTMTLSPTTTATPVATPSVSPSPSTTMTPTPAPTNTGQPGDDPPAGSVLINEIAWAGTAASAYDEWIELHNPGPYPLSLDGWVLSDEGDLNVTLSGTIAAYGFFLLERTDDTSVASITADLIYTGALSNSGETLILKSPSGSIIDSANSGGGGWPAGNAAARASMERLGGNDQPGNWNTFNGDRFAIDNAGTLIAGTPRQINSVFGPTATPTSTLQLTPSPSPTGSPPGSLLINEIAWAGTRASASDEWIELHNPGSEGITLDGWSLTDDGDIDISLSGVIEPLGYFLLERTDDASVSDIAADLIYSGSLRNSGEVLSLRDSSGQLIDSANRDGGSWPAGDAEQRYTMERWGGDDRPGNWGSFTGYGGLGRDAGGNPIQGTPRGSNSVLVPTPTPTWIPGSLVINEVLIRPHYDWEGTGGVTTADEFIEIYNRGPGAVWLGGWFLDDISGSGSKPFELPGVTVSPHSRAVFFRSLTHIALNDSGDSVRLLAPNGRLIDKIHYLRVRAYNLSYGRLPDGSNEMAYGLWPTPGEPNLLFVEPVEAPSSGHSPRPAYACPEGGLLTTFLPRLSRQPWQTRWLLSLGLAYCDQSALD